VSGTGRPAGGGGSVRAHGLVAVCLLVIAGSVGCSASTSPGASGSGGSGGATGGGSGGRGQNQCVVTLSPVAPTSFTDLRAGDTLRVRSTTSGSVAATAAWVWSVTAADGTGVPTVQPTADAALIDVTLPSPGTYTITASYGGPATPCTASVHVTIAAAGARTAFFVFRLTPPPGPWPAQQLPPVTVMGGTPSGDNILKLDEGTPVLIAPREAGGATGLGGASGTSGVVASYVRAVEQSSGLVTETHVAAAGTSGRLQLPPGLYDVLVVPDGTSFAPLLLASRRPTDLGAEAVILDGGMPVTGTVTDAAGAPLAGARISLRAGALPSTLGTSDARGSFTLRVRPGTYGATIVPGAAMPGTELSIAAVPGITVAAKPSAAAMGLSLRLATLATARIGLTVSGAGGAGKILVEARDPVPAAAMVEMTTGDNTTMAAATMRVRAELPIAATGAVTIGPLPRAHYRATVFATGAPSAGATVATVEDIDATGGDVQRNVDMGSPVAISGTLRPTANARTARVQAIDENAPAAVAADTVAPFVTQADDSGAFSVKVNPSRRYRLIVDPPSGGAFARAVLPPVTVAGTSIAVGAQELPAALLYAGRVVGPHLEPAPGTVVTAFCVGTAPVCVDPTGPIAEAVTTDDGSFRLMLPDPGVTP